MGARVAAPPQGVLLPSPGRLAKNGAVHKPVNSTIDIHSEEFLRQLMRRQLRLSVGCAATFLVALLGLPLANYFAPDLMATRVFGFTMSWLILGVLFFPLVWVIAWVFIRRSIALEEAEAAEVARSAAATPAGQPRH